MPAFVPWSGDNHHSTPTSTSPPGPCNHQKPSTPKILSSSLREKSQSRTLPSIHQPPLPQCVFSDAHRRTNKMARKSPSFEMQSTPSFALLRPSSASSNGCARCVPTQTSHWGFDPTVTTALKSNTSQHPTLPCSCKRRLNQPTTYPQSISTLPHGPHAPFK